MRSTAFVSRKVIYVSLNRGHSTAQTRTYTTLTGQLPQCCWPTAALDRPEKALHELLCNYAITNRKRNDLTLLNWVKNKQQHSCQGHCRTMFVVEIGKAQSVWWLDYTPTALEAEDFSPLPAAQSDSSPYPTSRSTGTRFLPRNTTTRAWSWPLRYI